MAKGRAGRTYTRDSSGRFASSGGGGKVAGKASGGRKAAAKPAAPARAKKAPAKPAAAPARAAGAPRGPKPPPPPWSPAMKQAAAKAKAQRADVKGKARPAAANKIAASPRRLNPQEKALASVLAQRSKYRSDVAVKREMDRRGFSMGQEQLLRTSQRINSKLGLRTPMNEAESKARRAALKKASGIDTRKRRG